MEYKEGVESCKMDVVNDVYNHGQGYNSDDRKQNKELLSWKVSSELKHAVESFMCDCPDLLEVTHDQDQSRSEGNNFLIKERHMKVEHLGWFGCSKALCLRSFAREKTLRKHMENCQQTQKIERKMSRKDVKYPENGICPDCGEDFGKFEGNRRERRAKTNKSKRHQDKHFVEKFVCNCPDIPMNVVRYNKLKVSKDFILKEKHIRVVHWGWFGCNKCIYSFEMKEQLTKHKNVHSENFCAYCGFVSISRITLKQHMKRNHESNPTQCPTCLKTIRNGSLLKGHINTCKRTTPCVICGAVVKKIKPHMETNHLDISEKKYNCSECEKGFMSKSILDAHRMNVHIKSQPHHCRYGCENRYNDVSNRNAHEKRRHGGLFANRRNPIEDSIELSSG